MDKNAYEEKARLHEEAEIARIKALSSAMARKLEDNRITKLDSPYRPFEIAFGAETLNKLNNFLFSLDKSEFANHPYLNDPLLLQYEVHEHLEFNKGSTYIIKKAWEQIKKEQELIDTAKQAYKTRLNKMLENNPNMPSSAPAEWCALCDGFNKFEALQEFGYPLPFDTVFGNYSPRRFYHEHSQDKKKLLEEPQ
jgi:hypothetical protein